MPTEGDFQRLTAAMHDFVAGQGWYEPESPRPQSPRNIAICLALEAAEVLEHFQWGEDARSQPALAEELADVMLYLLQLASLYEIDLGAAVRAKLEKNSQREWQSAAD